MKVRITTTVFATFFSFLVLAQQDVPSRSQGYQVQPEEILITAQRLTLRKQMMAAEKVAYDIFNKFNDERRFNINCSISQPTGTRLERQVCQPSFELEATRAHGQAYLDSYRALLAPYYIGNGMAPPPSDGAPVADIPQEAVIASQQGEYRRKMKQVAEEHPEFLQAIVEYSKIRKQYEKASNAAGK